MIEKTLAECGMTEADLAKRSGCTASQVARIVRGDCLVSAFWALQFEFASGVKAETWTALSRECCAARTALDRERIIKDLGPSALESGIGYRRIVSALDRREKLIGALSE